MSDVYKGIPKRVRIGCYDFSVVIMGGNDQDNDRLYGDMNAPLQRIRLAPHLSPQRLANTFIHEVLHAIHGYLGITDDSTEEECTTRGANGLCMFWQDNPEACKWWAKVNAMGAKA